jgi:hypothetical protein
VVEARPRESVPLIRVERFQVLTEYFEKSADRFPANFPSPQVQFPLDDKISSTPINGRPQMLLKIPGWRPDTALLP